MPTYLHPGVYIEEIPSGAKPIEGVSTSVAAFVGAARRGPAGEANLIQKLDDYTADYGEIVSEDDAMGFAVQGFYLNGGGAAYICRLVGDGSEAAEVSFMDEDTGATDILTVSANSVGEWGNEVYVRIVKPDPASLTFTLEVGHRKTMSSKWMKPSPISACARTTPTMRYRWSTIPPRWSSWR